MGRKAAWTAVVDEKGMSKLRPMYGPRPLDTYTSRVVHELDGRGKPTGRAKVRAIVDDCPCRGAIPYGSLMACEVCGRSGIDDRLDYLLKLKKQRDKYADRKQSESGESSEDESGTHEPG